MRWLEAFLFLTGLLLAGSDGAWFPWANLVGVGIFIGFTALVKRECREGTMKTYKQITAVKTTFRVLDFLKVQKRPVSGAEVAQALELSHATAMSHLATLEEISAVKRTGDTYHVGFKMATFWIDAKKHLEDQRSEIEQKLEIINC